MTMTIETMPATVKRGRPKWKGVVTPTTPARPTAEKSASPRARATSVPATRPMSTEMVATKPLDSHWTTTMTASVSRA